MSFLLISVVNRLGCESANVDNILTYKKIFVLELRIDIQEGFLLAHRLGKGRIMENKPEIIDALVSGKLWW